MKRLLYAIVLSVLLSISCAHAQPSSPIYTPSTSTVVYTAADEAAMLALAAKVGDFCVRSDNSTTYILQTLPATVLGNWTSIISLPSGNAYQVRRMNAAGTAEEWFDIRTIYDALDYAPGTQTSSTISAGIVAIGDGELALRKGTWVVDSDINVAAGITLSFMRGAVLSIDPGHVVAFTSGSRIKADRHNIFTGTGTVTFADGTADIVYPEWWTENTVPGITSMGTAIQTALNTLIPVKLAQTYYFTESQLDLKGNFLLGSGFSYSGSKSTYLKCGGALGASACIVTRTATAAFSRIAQLKDMEVYADNWTDVTGYGVDIEAPLIMENVAISKFPKSNLILHWNGSNNGPWGSRFINVDVTYAGEHGVIVGAGAGPVYFEGGNYKWNGCTIYGVAPVVAGNYDGFLINGTETFGGLYAARAIESMKIVGGDSSYNSRYGWNFFALYNSILMPGYAEANLQAAPGQANLGISLYNSVIFFANMGPLPSIDNINMGAGTGNTIFVDGQHVGDGASNIVNARYNYFNLNMSTWFSATSDKSKAVFFTPDPATGDTTISLIGNARLGIANLPIHADNAAALAAGLAIDRLYKTPTGAIQVVY